MSAERSNFFRFGNSVVAYSTSGHGPPLVFPQPSFGHLEMEFESGSMRSFYQALASKFTLVRYDRLGTGMSDRSRTSDTWTLEFEVDVLDAIVDHLGLARPSFFGFSYGGVVAAAWAARRPKWVKRLLLFGAYAAGGWNGEPLLESVGGVLRANWDLGARLLTAAFLPGADRDLSDWFAGLRRESCDGEVAASLLELWEATDLRDALGRITAPTLVLHRRDDPVVALERGRMLASLIPGSRFLVLEGSQHQPWYGDTAAVLRLGGEFFGSPLRPSFGANPRNGRPISLTPREREVLALVAEGLNDAAIAQRLVLSAHTVHRHVANVRTRLGYSSRAGAAAYATRAGWI